MQYDVIESARSRRMAITVRPDGTVSVRVPRGTNTVVIERFVLKHAEWIKKRIAFYERIDDKIILPKLRASTREVKELKERAKIFAETRLDYFNRHYQFRYTKITIGNQKSRWGSCSPNGKLRFNYRIVLLPPELADYIVVHELCHVREMNHGKNFWNLVGETMPKHKSLRARLKKVFEI